MTFSISPPIARALSCGPYLVLQAIFLSQSTYAQLPGESPTPGPQTAAYSSCSAIPSGQTANRTACDKHFSRLIHINGIKVIPHDLTSITRNVIDGENPLHNQALYIFESIDSQSEVVEYDLWSGFKMPAMSTLAGNLDSDELPRLTLTENTDPGFTFSFDAVITAESSTGDYWLADLEVDSGGDHYPGAVLKLGGARFVSLNNVKVVRDPANNDMGIKAIELGCRDSSFTGGNPTPRYEIIDSEIDLTLTHSGAFAPDNPGEAIYVGGCEGFGKRTDLKINNTLIVIDDRTEVPGSGDVLSPTPTPTSALPPTPAPESSGSVFFIQGSLHGSHTLVNFLPGSTCNNVENVHGMDISSDHMGIIQGALDADLVTGVVGLMNGNGWGWDTETTTPVNRHGNTYEGIFRPWNEWYAAGRCDDLSCNDPTASTSVTIPASLCQMTSTIAPTSTLVASTSAGTGVLASSTVMEPFNNGTGMMTTSTEAPTVEMTSSIVVPEASPSPSPTPPGPGVKNFANCAAISTGDDTARDRAVCEEAYGMMSFTGGVTKIPYYVTSLSGVITEASRLYIFDSDSPSPAYLTAEGLVEYDLPVDFTMPDDSGFAGNRKGDKHPEITIVDGAHSHYVIRVNHNRKSFLFAHIEVDSRLSAGVSYSSDTGGILNLNGAGNVTMNDVKLVRREGLPNFNFSAITLGCSRGGEPTLTPTSTPTPFSSPIYTIRDTVIDITAGGGFSGFAGSAFVVSGCNSSANEKAQLSISDSTISIRNDTTLNISSGTVFDFVGLGNTNLELVNSTCNQVVNPDNGDIANPMSESYRYHYLGVLDNFSNNSANQLFTGVFGLKNGNGWGLLKEGEGYRADLLPWISWQPIDVACAMPTPSTTLMTATAGTEPTESTDGGTPETASISVSMTEIMPSPTPVSPIRMCEDMFDEGSADRLVCEQYIEHPDFEFTKVVKIPHTMRALSSLISETDTNTLFIFDADVPGSGFGSGTSTEGPIPSPTPGACTVCPTNTGIEYDLPIGFVMPSGSGFVGNRIAGKRPEITIVDNQPADYIIRVSRRDQQGNFSHLDGNYLFAHIEVDSKEADTSSGNEGIMYLNGARSVTMIDVALVRRDKLQLHQGYNALMLGCANTGSVQPQIIVQNSVIDISASGAFQDYIGSAFSVERGAGISCSNTKRVQLQTSGTTVIIKPGKTFHSSTGTVFYFFSEDYPAIAFDSGSVCNRVISSLNGEDLSDDGGHRYIGIQPDFSFSSHEQQGISENEIYTGVFGLKYGKGWGMIPFADQQDMNDQDYRADLRPWCFWEQQTPSVNVTCPTASVIAESCTPMMESTTVLSMPTSTPEVTMAETSTMLTSSEAGPEETSSVGSPSPTTTESMASSTNDLAATSTMIPVPTNTPGINPTTSSAPETATPVSQTSSEPMTTSASSTSSEPVTTSVSDTYSETTATATTKSSSGPPVTASTSRPSESMPTLIPSGMPNIGQQSGDNSGWSAGDAIGTVVGVGTAILLAGQIIAHPLYHKATSTFAKATAIVLGVGLPWLLQSKAWPLIQHSLAGGKTGSSEGTVQFANHEQDYDMETASTGTTNTEL